MKIQRCIFPLLVALCAGRRAAGQTTVDLTKQGKLGTGTILPVRCTVGQLFFKTDVPAGSNLYACAALDAWTPIGLLTMSGDASGNQQSLIITGIQNRGISTAVPADRDVLRWNVATSQWEPAAAMSTGSGGPPATCPVGNFYLQADPVNNIQQLYVCSSIDTWSMASFRSGSVASRPVNCVMGQTWLSVDTGVLAYCSASGSPGTWRQTVDLGPGSMERTLPGAVNSTVDIGTFDADTTEGSASYEVFVSTHGTGGNIGKSYRFSVEQNMSSNGCRTVAPLTSTGPDSGQDWDLEAYPGNVPNLQLRLRRTAGSGTTIASIALYRYAGGTYSFTSSSDVNTGVPVPSSLLSTSVLTQQDGSAYYNGNLIIPVTGTPSVGYVPTATSATTATWAATPSGGGGSGNPANPVTTPFSSTPTFNCGSSTAGTITTFKLSAALSANIASSTLSGCTSGQLLAFILTQDGTGGRTFAPPSGFDPVVISPLPNVTTTLLFQWDGTNGRLVNSSNDSGYIFIAGASAPPTPPAGNGVLYFDSFNKNLAVKDDAGLVKHGVKTDTGAPNNYISAIADDGTITKSQPGFSNLSGSVLKAQTPLTTKGDLWVTDGANMNRLGVGSSGQVLTVDSTQPDGVKWGQVAPGGCITSGTGGLQKADGSGGCASSALTDDGSAISSGEPVSIGANYFSSTQTAGSTGTTANTLCKMDNSAQVVTAAAGDKDTLGVCVTTQASGQTVQLANRGIVNCAADNSTTLNHLLGVGTATGGRCKDLGVTDSSLVSNGLQIIGKARTAVSAGSNVSAELWGPGYYGTYTNVVQGVTVSGTPSPGQVITASSGTAATWQTPSVGGGGGLASTDVWSNGAVPLVGASSATPGIYVTGAGTHSDGFTCPATNPATGNPARCWVHGAVITNTSGVAQTSFPEIKISSTYYPLVPPAGSPLAAGTSGTFAIGYIMEPGETLAINVGAISGFTFTFSVKAADATTLQKSVKLMSYAVGNNTLYTCPAATVCEFTSGSNFGDISPSSPGMRYVNATGAARAISVNVVPSGGSVAASNKVYNNSSATNLNGFTIFLPNIKAGDYLNLVTDSIASGQFAWVNVSERAR